MYKQIEATPCSKHELCKWVAEKGESSLEKFHHLLAHFANQGMRRELPDSLGLWGTARYNLKLDLKKMVLLFLVFVIPLAFTTIRHWQKSMQEPDDVAAYTTGTQD
jgi:hypothetical protein